MSPVLAACRPLGAIAGLDADEAENRGLREALARLNTVATEQAAVIAALREQLHDAGLEPAGAPWTRIGAAV